MHMCELNKIFHKSFSVSEVFDPADYESPFKTIERRYFSTAQNFTLATSRNYVTAAVALNVAIWLSRSGGAFLFVLSIECNRNVNRFSFTEFHWHHNAVTCHYNCWFHPSVVQKTFMIVFIMVYLVAQSQMLYMLSYLCS